MGSHGDVQSDAGFPVTEWSLVFEAGQTRTEEGSAALEQLCRIYWPAIYGFLRRQGHSPHDAEDLTQGFLTCLLEKESLIKADPAKGRFRSFLLGALKYFIADQQKFAAAQRRGGGQQVVSLDDETAEQHYSRVPASELPPDRVYDQQWAWRLLEQALRALREECARFGQVDRFERLKEFLTTDPHKGDYLDLAKRLNLKPNAVAVAIHRLRQRYRTLVRHEVMRTVASVQDLEDELCQLFSR